MIRRVGCILLGVLLLTTAVVAAQQSTPQPGYIYYTVAQGDSLGMIALRYGTTTRELLLVNNISNPNLIYYGMVLRIPTGAAPAAPTQPPVAPSAAPSALPPPTPNASSLAYDLGGEVSSFEHESEMQKAAMTWAKISLSWSPGVLPDSASQAIDATHANGFKLLLKISGDSAALNADPAGYGEQFAAYLGQVAALAPDAIEVWGDMNIASISPKTYVTLLTAAYEAIKRGNPSVLVISGAPTEEVTAGEACDTANCDELAYLQGMAQAGVDQVADCIGMRYTLGAVPPDATSGDVRGSAFAYYYPAVVRTFASIFPNKPLCFTRIGYLSLTEAAPGYEWAVTTTLELRAEWLARAALLARATGRIRLFIVYRVDSGDLSADDPQTGYAITSPDHFCLTCLALSTAIQGQS